MGDRCYIRIVCRQQDQKRLEDNGYFCETENADGTVYMVCEEANYGDNDLREELASEGIPFFGWHGSGGGYGPCVFAAADGKHIEAETNFDDSGPVAVIREDGTPDPTDVQNAREYYRVLKLAQEQMKPQPATAQLPERITEDGSMAVERGAPME